MGLQTPLLADEPKQQPVSVREELLTLTALAWPMCVSYFCRVGMGLTDLAMVGRLVGTDALAGASVATIWMITTGSFLGRGFSSGVGVLCSQAYGAKSYSLVGEWLLIGVVCVFLAHLPICLVWYFTGDVFSLFVETEEVQQLATSFARWSILGLAPQVLYTTVESYFQAIKVVKPALYVNALFLGVNALLNWVLINGCGGRLWGWEGLGFIGSPIGTAITRILLLMMYWCYSLHQQYHLKPHRCWPETGLSVRGWGRIFTARRLKVYLLKQVLPLSVAANLEEWQLQLVALFAAKLGDISIATHNATLNVFFMLAVFQIGIVQASSVMIGTHLGAMNHVHAKAVAWLTFKVCGGVGLVCSALLVLTRHEVGKIFSDDQEVIDLTGDIMLLAGGSFFFLSIFYASMGVLDGQAVRLNRPIRVYVCVFYLYILIFVRSHPIISCISISQCIAFSSSLQRPGAVAFSFFVGAWIVSVPLSYVFGFPLGLDLMGLWYGLTCGYSMVTILSLFFVWKSDWPALAVLAFNRAEKDAADVIISKRDEGDEENEIGRMSNIN